MRLKILREDPSDFLETEIQMVENHLALLLSRGNASNLAVVLEKKVHLKALKAVKPIKSKRHLYSLNFNLSKCF